MPGWERVPPRYRCQLPRGDARSYDLEDFFIKRTATLRMSEISLAEHFPLHVCINDMLGMREMARVRQDGWRVHAAGGADSRWCIGMVSCCPRRTSDEVLCASGIPRALYVKIRADSLNEGHHDAQEGVGCHTVAQHATHGGLITPVFRSHQRRREPLRSARFSNRCVPATTTYPWRMFP